MWTGVFCLLMLELGLTLILVIPVPRKIRNWICLKVSKLELKKRLRIPLTGLFFALLFALLDTTNYLAHIYTTKEGDPNGHPAASHGGLPNPIDRHLIKEKEYRAGRNIYLVGFALTLLFVIGRITELMQEHAELEGKIENLRLAASMMGNDETAIEPKTTTATDEGDNDAPNEGIEMKPMGLKKKD